MIKNLEPTNVFAGQCEQATLNGRQLNLTSSIKNPSYLESSISKSLVLIK